MSPSPSDYSSTVLAPAKALAMERCALLLILLRDYVAKKPLDVTLPYSVRTAIPLLSRSQLVAHLDGEEGGWDSLLECDTTQEISDAEDAAIMACRSYAVAFTRAALLG